MKWLYKYTEALIAAAGIIFFIIFTFLYFGKLHPVVAAVAGLLSAVPGRLFWRSYMSPVLTINPIPEPRLFEPEPGELYIANRINVENTGRSAATNCKAYIISKNGKGRVCWVVPKERPNATINPEDSEGLDLCAFYEGKQDESVPQIIAPIEEGWPTPNKSRILDGITECEVLITADNAKPVKAKVIFNLESKLINISP